MAYGTILGKTTESKYVCRFIIGTSNAGWTTNDCDYLCDGTDDQAEINAAIAALPESGGEVVILDGTYSLTGPITTAGGHVLLSGNGQATVLYRAVTGENEVVLSVGGPSCVVRDLTFDVDASAGGIMIGRDMSTKILSLSAETTSAALIRCAVYGGGTFSSAASDPTGQQVMLEGCGFFPPIHFSTSQSYALSIQVPTRMEGCWSEKSLVIDSDANVDLLVSGNQFHMEFDVSTFTFQINSGNACIVGNQIRCVSCVNVSSTGTLLFSGNVVQIAREWSNVVGIRVRSNGNVVTGNRIVLASGQEALGSQDYSIHIVSGEGNVATGNVLAKAVTDGGTNSVVADNAVIAT